MPIRLQRKRTKGWRLPEGAVIVSRPTKWGNPFTLLSVVSWYLGGYMDDRMAIWREEAMFLYRQWATDQLEDIYYDGRDPYPLSRCDLDFSELRGKDLVCWCRVDAACHADVLLEIANKPDGAAGGAG